MQKKRQSGQRKSVKGKSKKIKMPLQPTFEWPEKINIKHVIMEDGSLSFVVSPQFATMCCLYFPEELRKSLTYHVQTLLKGLIQGVFEQDSEGNYFLSIDEKRWQAGERDLDPIMRELIHKYSDYAYNVFTKALITKMYQVPETLVQNILQKIITMLDEDDRAPFKLKKGVRQMWDELAQKEGKALKDDWVTLKPGTKPFTSKQERAEMLAYYHTMLPTCQKAKDIYKDPSIRRWKVEVKKKFPTLGEVIIDNIPNHKPSWLAELQTGIHFRKVIGKDLRGLAEVRRQLGKARDEAMEEYWDK